MHSIHGDIHEIGLQDNCQACFLHAQKPWSTLDEIMLRDLVISASHRNTYRSRSDAEALAIANILNTMERFGKLCEVAPEECVNYLASNWKIRVMYK